MFGRPPGSERLNGLKVVAMSPMSPSASRDPELGPKSLNHPTSSGVYALRNPSVGFEF